MTRLKNLDFAKLGEGIVIKDLLTSRMMDLYPSQVSELCRHARNPEPGVCTLEPGCASRRNDPVVVTREIDGDLIVCRADPDRRIKFVVPHPARSAFADLLDAVRNSGGLSAENHMIQVTLARETFRRRITEA